MTQVDLTPEQQEERRDYVHGLREAASFIEAHPEIPLPIASAQNAFVHTRVELAAVAKACGGKWGKAANDNFFYISKPFAGGHSYDVIVSRETVCRKVVTGTRIEPAVEAREVEEFHWVCDEPLLADGVR